MQKIDSMFVLLRILLVGCNVKRNTDATIFLVSSGLSPTLEPANVFN